MIDLHELREKPEIYEDACRKKRIGFDIQKFLELDKEYKAQKARVENLRASQNAFNKEIQKLSGEEKTQKLAQMKDVAEELKQGGVHLKVLEEKWNKDLLFIPSPPLDVVPEGKDDTENVEIKRWGDIPTFSFKTLDHVVLGRNLRLLDIERGVKVSGARNYFLMGQGVRLQHSVLQLALDLLHQKGYTLMDPPHLVKYEAMMGTSYFPGGEDQTYQLDERDQGNFLIGTAEVPVCAFHSDEILEAVTLPLRYAGYSPCYRREAGTYGKDTHGIYRIHQFYKVEQVVIAKADSQESAKLHQELLSNAEELMQLLELPYRVVEVCTGDLGRGQVRKNDIEAWMPSRGNYGETHSCSTFYDFQARRLNIRYRGEQGKTVYCHTLNNTLIASPRILIPLLEVNQREDGSVNVPKVLRKYMGIETIRK